MPTKSFEELHQSAETIRTNTYAGSNTAGLVGGLFRDIIEKLKEAIDNCNNLKLDKAEFETRFRELQESMSTIPVFVEVTNVSLSASSIALAVGSTQHLTATVNPSNATIKGVNWSSSNPSVASVSSSGLVTAHAAGSATITVTSNSDSAKRATCNVTVTAATVAVSGVSVSPSTLSLEVGATRSLSATVSPSNVTNKAVTWSTSDQSVATVSAEGVVTAVSAGSAVITATSNADGTKTGSCAVTVTKPTRYYYGYGASEITEATAEANVKGDTTSATINVNVATNAKSVFVIIPSGKTVRSFQNTDTEETLAFRTSSITYKGEACTLAQVVYGSNIKGNNFRVII